METFFVYTKRQKFMKIFIFLFVLFVMIACSNTAPNKENTNIAYKITETEYTDSLSTEEKELLQSGDIIFRHGRGMISLSISARLNEFYPVSHCGIIKKSNDSIFIIHSLPLTASAINGLQQCFIDEWTQDTYGNCIVVSRFRSSENEKVLNAAEFYLSKKLPFNNQFDLNDTTKFFCNQLVFHILDSNFETSFVDLVSNQEEALQFAKLLDTTLFDIIINHHHQ